MDINLARTFLEIVAAAGSRPAYRCAAREGDSTLRPFSPDNLWRGVTAERHSTRAVSARSTRTGDRNRRGTFA